MSAKLESSHDEHHWQLLDRKVTQLRVDPSSVSLHTWTLQGSAEVRLDVPFAYREADGVLHELDPESPESLNPLLSLVGRSIAALTITRRGALTVQFGDGSLIEVTPHPTYEAWEISGDGDLEQLGYLCSPGGGSPWG